MSSDGADRIAVWEEERNDSAEQAFVERHGHVNEIAVGTLLEYDGWQWALVSEFAMDREKPKVGFILLDEVADYVHQRLEEAEGCRQHYHAVKHLCDSEHEYWTDVEYVITDDVWSVLGPIHPEYRGGRSVDTGSERQNHEEQA